MDNVEITLLSGAAEGNAGDSVSVSPSRAKTLVRGGVARYATKGNAREAGGNPDSPRETATAKVKK